MTNIDNELRTALRQGQESAETGRVPEFAAVWARAESSLTRQRRRTRAISGIAAAAAVLAVVIVGQLRPGEQQWQFVDPDEFANSTSWAAPSDVLLPDRQFDIFGEVPVLIESTGSEGGALL